MHVSQETLDHCREELELDIYDRLRADERAARAEWASDPEVIEEAAYYGMTLDELWKQDRDEYLAGRYGRE